MCRRNFCSLILGVFFVLAIASCAPTTVEQDVQNIGENAAAEDPTPASTPTMTAVPTPTSEPIDPADTIFFNGVVITMAESQPQAEAIAIKEGLIQAVGSNAEVLAFQGEETVLIDLEGQTMLPGFVDGHTHLLAFPGRLGRSLAEAQETAIQYGFTTVNEMWADMGYVGLLLEAEAEGNLRLRVNLFASYNDGILDENRHKVLLETWYPENAPLLDPTSHLRIPGIKIFVDGDNADAARGCWAMSQPYEAGSPILGRGICGTTSGDLYWSQDELNRVVADAQAAGYQVAFHAMGDGAIEMALNAIEFALDGESNELYRHQIEHNSMARPDLLTRYEEMGVLASVRGFADLCFPEDGIPAFGPERSQWYANRYALANLDIHAYIETDFGWTIEPDVRYHPRTLDPIMHLYGIVTHLYVLEDGSTCDPVSWAAVHQISVERALQMLTIEPAYAVSMEAYIGSLEEGKFADLIILSGNPLAVDPTELLDLRVWMTMIDGQLEYCAEGHEAVCPAE